MNELQLTWPSQKPMNQAVTPLVERAVCVIGDITSLDSWVGSWGEDGDTAHTSTSAAASRPRWPSTMGLFLRAAENSSLLLGRKRRLKVMLCWSYFIFPVLSVPSFLLSFLLSALEVTSVNIIFRGHSSSPGSKAVALHQPWHLPPPAQGKGWGSVES